MRKIINKFVHSISRIIRSQVVKRKFKRLTNKTFTLFSCNCTGGVLYHELGMRFLSPTINMYMDCEDFIKFCENPKYYLSLNLEKYDGDIEREYPLATLGDITLYLVHYKTFEEALKKWDERKKRINWDNIYIIGTDRDGFNDGLSKRFDALPYKKVLFIHLPDDNKNHFYIKGFESETQVGSIVGIVNKLTGKRVYDQFDWTSFLNK